MKCWLLIISLLLPLSAVAQNFGNIPGHSVLGNPGTALGPARPFDWGDLPSAGGAATTPMSYGCVGDGVADDTACVQSAITANYGGVLQFDGNHLYRVNNTLNVVNPIELRGPYRHGMWVSQTTNMHGCTWGLDTRMNQTLLNVTATTVTITGICMQLGPMGSAQLGNIGTGVPAAAGAAIALRPASAVTYQSGATIAWNTILNPYDGIVLDGPWSASSGCCGQGTTSNGNLVAWNTIMNPAHEGITNGRNTANAATVGAAIWDNAIGCISGPSHTAATGVALYDGAMDYDGTEVGPEGCNIGVAVIPGDIGGVAQNAELNPAKGVLGDQSVTHDFLIQPRTNKGIAAYIEVVSGWASNTGNVNEVLISNLNGGIVDGVKLIGGVFHSGMHQSLPVVDIEGGSNGGVLQNIQIVGAHISCWGEGTYCTAPLLKINASGANEARNIVVSANHIGADYQAGNATSAIGIQVLETGGGAPAFLNISGNDLVNNTRPIAFTPNSPFYRILFANNIGVDDLCPGYTVASTVNINDADSCMFMNGNGTITTLGNPWGDRLVRMVIAGTVNLATGGNICRASTPPSGSVVNMFWQAGAGCWSY